MSNVQKAFLILETSTGNHPDPGTGGPRGFCNFSLEIDSKPEGPYFKEEVPEDDDIQHYQPGLTDIFEYNFEHENFDLEQLKSQAEIRLVAHSENAWLPESIWLIAETDSGERELVVGQPDWPENKAFSTDPDKGHSSYPITHAEVLS
jgi:hypothetical protein